MKLCHDTINGNPLPVQRGEGRERGFLIFFDAYEK
jgi:hypothetical protein